MIGAFVFLNLVVAVILENFTALGNIDPSLVSASDIADFKEEWAVFDPDADGFIPTKDLPVLLLSLPAPLGLKGTKLVEGSNPRPKALKFCLGLGLTQKDGHVQFKAVLDALIKKNYADKEAVIEPEPGSPGGKESSTPKAAVLTPRRREMAGIYAEELISDFIRRHKEANGGVAFSPGKVKRSPSPKKATPNGASPEGEGGAVDVVAEPSPALATPEPMPAATPPPADGASSRGSGKPRPAGSSGGRGGTPGASPGGTRRPAGPPGSGSGRGGSRGNTPGGRGSGPAGTPPSRQEQMSRTPPKAGQPGQRPTTQRPQRPPGSVARTPSHGGSSSRSSTELPRPSRMPPPGASGR